MPLRLAECGELLSVEEVAAVLRWGRDATYAAVRRGLIPACMNGNRFVVPRAAVARLLDEAEQRAAAEATARAATQPAAAEATVRERRRRGRPVSRGA